MKGISQEMWILGTIILGLFLIGGMAWVFDAIASSGNAIGGCTNFHNVVAEATGIELC
jgi:hypothetical protein